MVDLQQPLVSMKFRDFNYYLLNLKVIEHETGKEAFARNRIRNLVYSSLIVFWHIQEGQSKMMEVNFMGF